MARILKNALETPDGTIIESRTAHYITSHQDKNGKKYSIAGGHTRVIPSSNGDEKLITFTEDDPHILLRKHVTWGTGPLMYRKYVAIEILSTRHINNILNDKYEYRGQTIELMKCELIWREETEAPDQKEALELARENSY